MGTRARTLLTTAALLAFLAAGCDALVDRPALALEFGSPYNVLFGEPVETAAGVESSTPFTDVSGDLHVAVEFSGGCTDHSFRLDYTLAENAATLWLVHASNGETCESLLRAEVVVDLQTEILEKNELILVAPGGRDEVVTRLDIPMEGP